MRRLSAGLIALSAVVLVAPQFVCSQPIDRPAAALDENAARSAVLRRGFSDEFDQATLGTKGPEVGAAARVVHGGCRRVLRQFFQQRPGIADRPFHLPESIAAMQLRVTGN